MADCNLSTYFFPPHIKFFLVCLFCAALISCESDPILAPSTEDAEDKGSYGLSTFPGHRTTEDEGRKSNPELF